MSMAAHGVRALPVTRLVRAKQSDSPCTTLLQSLDHVGSLLYFYWPQEPQSTKLAASIVLQPLAPSRMHVNIITPKTKAPCKILGQMFWATFLVADELWKAYALYILSTMFQANACAEL